MGGWIQEWKQPPSASGPARTMVASITDQGCPAVALVMPGARPGFAVETLLCTAGHSAHRWPRPTRCRKHPVKCPLQRPTGLGDSDAGRKQGTGPPRSGGGRGPADELAGE